MTNPNESVGTNGAYGGRTSVNAINDVLACFKSRGIISGWATSVSSGMTVNVGGAAGIRDVAIAEDNAGNRTTINNRSATPIAVTLAAASSSSARIDYIVAYVNNPPTVLVTTVDNPGAAGIVAVQGTTSAPDEAAIRAAITADGGTGSTAYYVVLATVTVPAGATDLSGNNIAQGASTSPNVNLATMTVYMPSNYVLPNGSQRNTLPLTSATNSKSGSLSSGSNGIVIGKGISRVIVSGSIFCGVNTTYNVGYPGALVIGAAEKNNVGFLSANLRATSDYVSCVLPSKVVGVAEGDVITVAVQNNNSQYPTIGGGSDLTFLSVTAIG